MISFHKHAIAGTDCHVSLLGRLPGRGCASVRFAALMILLLAASAAAFATPRQGRRVRKHRAEKPAPRAQAEKTRPDAKVPVRLTRVDTPDGHSIIADIGEFPTDLNEAGQYFLEREFFERFASDMLGIGDSPYSESNAALKVAMWPRQKNQREGDFIFGKVKGRIIVIVEKRRVTVACMLGKAQSRPQQMAAAGAFGGRLTAG